MIILKRTFEKKCRKLEEQLVDITISNPRKKWLRDYVIESLQRLKKAENESKYLFPKLRYLLPLINVNQHDYYEQELKEFINLYKSINIQNITNMTWVEKYRPKSFLDIKGQDEAVKKVKDFVSSFFLDSSAESRKKQALILYGPPGTGKTTLAHVAALETSSEIFELNASDLRDRKKLEETLKPAIEQQSLLSSNKKKIILVDEVDGITSVDRGGLQELLDLISSTTYPILITANDIWDKKFSTLRSKTELVQLKEIDYKTIKDVLINILRKEKLFIDNNVLTSISIKSKGDIRAAINDLQTISQLKDGSKEIIDERNKEKDIFNALKLIFKGKPTPETLNIFDEVNMPLDQIILWVEENIPAEYKGKDLYRAYEYLSRADIFKGRIYKQQYWRFLLYENIFLSYGISSAKSSIKNTGFTSYKKPTRILKIWMNNQKNLQKKSISSKYSKYVHIGGKRAMKEFPIIKNIIKSNPQIQKELKLSEDEIEYLNN